MKLGLLVVLAVVVLVPSLSEGRVISRCELKEKLEEQLPLPRKLQKFKDRILAKVICEVERRSRLNTSRVIVIGDQRTTVKQTVPELTQAAAVAGVKNRITGIHPLYTEITEPFITNGFEDKFNGRESNENSYASYEVDHSQEFFLNDEESKFDEEEIEQDDNRMIDEGDSEKEDGQELELEEGGEHKKKSLPLFGGNSRVRSWSLRYHGLFQLSDSTFCDSGYRRSRNVCKTSCKSFTDDDIRDDIDCFVKSRYWVYLLTTARHCPRFRTFFNKCT